MKLVTTSSDYGFIRFTSVYGGSHMMGWENRGGDVFLVDPQTGTEESRGYFSAIPDSIRWTTISGFNPTEQVLNIIYGKEK
nr:Uncharacterised protein [Streptococcus thermophilus]